jgi:arylsulfatase
MSKPFEGVVNVDIRDSMPDWEIVTQPGNFSLAGEGVSIGRDSGSSVSPDYDPPFEFRGGTIDRVAIDVTGDPFVDHEKEVLAYLARD